MWLGDLLLMFVINRQKNKMLYFEFNVMDLKIFLCSMGGKCIFTRPRLKKLMVSLLLQNH